MKVFEKQTWHLLALLLLTAGVIALIRFDEELLYGSFWGLSTKSWLIISLLTPVVHQVYVWLCWRFELHHHSLTKMFGEKAFLIYFIGFFMLFPARMVFLLILSIANRNTFSLNPFLAYSLSAVMTLAAAYAFYSVRRYFGMKRAAGLDHFDSSISRLPFVKKGIFRYTGNGMYVYAFLIFYVPALLFLSKAALLTAIFSHIYIWVHYYCTELPDIKIIYADKNLT